MRQRGQRRRGPMRLSISRATAGRARSSGRGRGCCGMTTYFYVAAEMVEPDLWATLRQRDCGHFSRQRFRGVHRSRWRYSRVLRARGQRVRDAVGLMLIKPYRDGGRAIDGWDIAGLKVGVDLRGTINRPGDRDNGWSVELAMPWRILREAAPEQSCSQGRRSVARQLFASRMADASRRWRLHEGAQARRQRPASRKQLGLEPAGRDQHAHAGTVGVRPVLRKDRGDWSQTSSLTIRTSA